MADVHIFYLDTVLAIHIIVDAWPSIIGLPERFIINMIIRECSFYSSKYLVTTKSTD